MTHWCHQCEQRIVATAQLCCPQCNSEFIEEVEDPMALEEHPAAILQHNIISANNAPGPRRPAIVFQVRANNRTFPLANFGNPFAATSAADVGANPDLFNQVMQQVTQTLNGVPNRQNGASPNVFGQLLNSMFGINFQQQDLFSSDMESLLNHLFETARCQGPPPASADYISKIPVIKPADKAQIDELGTSCSVCYDEFELEQEVLLLPCKHAFHSGCILQWLKTSNTCPVCRFELPTDDQDYERRKAQRQSEGNSEQNQFNRRSSPQSPTLATTLPGDNTTDVSSPPPEGMYS